MQENELLARTLFIWFQSFILQFSARVYFQGAVQVGSSPGSVCWGWWRLPSAAGQGLAARARPTSQPGAGQPGAPGQAQAQALGTSLGIGPGRGQAGLLAHGWAQLGGAPGQEGPGCGELETVPVAASPGQGLTTPGG